MIVECKTNALDSAIVRELGIPEPRCPKYSSITPKKKYVVLGVECPSNYKIFDGLVTIHIKNDQGGLTMAPLLLFDVIENRPSQHWKIKSDATGFLSMLPEPFFVKFFHDDLSEGLTEVVDEFRRISRLLEEEALSEDKV